MDLAVPFGIGMPVHRARAVALCALLWLMWRGVLECQPPLLCLGGQGLFEMSGVQFGGWLGGSELEGATLTTLGVPGRGVFARGVWWVTFQVVHGHPMISIVYAICM